MQGRPHYWNSETSRLKVLFRNFFSQQKTERIGDAFFIPQMLNAGILMAFLSISNIFVQQIGLILGIYDSIREGKNKVEDAFFEKMFKCLQMWQANLPGTPFPEGIFNMSLYIINFIGAQLLDLATGFYWSFIFSANQALIICFVAMIAMLADFKDRIMRLRRGDYSHIKNLEAIEIKDHTSFLGFYVSGVAVSFLIIWFTLGLLQVGLFLPVVWLAVWQNVFVIIGLLWGPILEGICNSQAKGIIIHQDYIMHRRYFSPKFHYN